MEFQSYPYLSPPPLRGRMEVGGIIYIKENENGEYLPHKGLV